MKLRYLVLASAIGLSATCTYAANEIKIGVVQPLTGSVAFDGQIFVEGARLAAKQRNEQGGIAGRQVQLIIEDGQCQPTSTVNAAEKLITSDKVGVLVGAFCSSATSAAIPVAARNNMILLTGVSSAADLTERGVDVFFRSAETDLQMANAFGGLLKKELDLASSAFIAVNDDWGRGSVKHFSEILEANGVKNVSTEYFDHGTNDFSTLIAKIRRASPDGIFIAAETQDGSTLLRQIQEFGISSKIFGTGSWATTKFMKLAGDSANGVYAAVPYVSSLDTDRNNAFVEAYKAEYGETPGKYSAGGYNAINIVMDALEKTNGDTDASVLRSALLKTNYEAPNGTYRFTDKGDSYGFDAILVQLNDGEFNVIATVPTTAN